MTNIDDIEVDPDTSFTFCIDGKVTPDYRMCRRISEWLQSNLEELCDDNDKVIFGKVNFGYNENTLKTFGVRPVCDIYIDRVEYNTDFDETRPSRVEVILVFYSKGNNNQAYLRIAELHDYVMQEFCTNESFKVLDGLVRDTRIMESQLMSQPMNKKWGVMGAFRLSHTLY